MRNLFQERILDKIAVIRKAARDLRQQTIEENTEAVEVIALEIEELASAIVAEMQTEGFYPRSQPKKA